MIRQWRMRGSRAAEMLRILNADPVEVESEFPAAFDRIPGSSRASVIAHPFLESVALGAFFRHDRRGRGPRPEAMALERTRDVLAAVPDPLTFVEAASGRSDPAILPVMH